MKALVFGAQGQVGSELVLAAPAYDIDVFGLGSRDLDITDLAALRQVIDQHSPDIIINAAAYTAVDLAESEVKQAFSVNAYGVENIAKAAKAKATPVLHLSTDYVYDGDKRNPYLEVDSTNPLSVYGASKLKGEELLLSACPESLILRTAWVYGRHGKNFVKTMLSLAERRQELSVVGDQYGCPTQASDIARTLLKLAKRYDAEKELVWGVYHYSGSVAMSWYEFALKAFDIAQQQGLLSKVPKTKAIPSSEYPTPAKRPMNSVLCCDKILSIYDDVELSDVDHGLTQLVAAIK